MFKSLYFIVGIFTALTLLSCQDSKITDENNSAGLQSEAKSIDVKDITPQVEIATSENMFGLSEAQFRVFDDLIAAVLDEAPLIARVQDIRVSYPEWQDSDPNDHFEEALIKYEVDLIEILNGSFPNKFSYIIYGEAEPVSLREKPYIVSLCKDKNNQFVADAMIGVLPAHIDGFEKLLRARLKADSPNGDNDRLCQNG